MSIWETKDPKKPVRKERGLQSCKRRRERQDVSECDNEEEEKKKKVFFRWEMKSLNMHSLKYCSRLRDEFSFP